jgi:hypothetical protein
LDHPNILPFLGVNDNMFHPSFCLISPWKDNGNLLSFLEKNPHVDRLKAVLETTHFPPVVIDLVVSGSWDGARAAILA